MKLLVVLLGSNPLPVYVTIKAVQNEKTLGFDKVLFVFSSKTQKYIAEIREKAGLTNDMIGCCNLKDSHRDPKKIRDEIEASLKRMLEEHETYSNIHFNHTGGTKTMAIHGFIAISDFATGHNIPFSISDLDSDIHRLNVSNKTENNTFFRLPENKNYLECEECSIDFNGLVKLHGFEEKKPGTAEISKPDCCISLEAFYQEILPKDEANVFPHDKFHFRWSTLKSDNKFKKKKDKLCDYIVKETKIPIKEDVEETEAITKDDVLAYFFLNYFNQSLELSECLTGKNLYNICEFIDGKWLEYLVFSIVNKLINDKQINVDEALMSEVVFLGDQKANRDCELDVVIMKGYQLTLISCTTASSISIVKQKAFEAIFRSNQLGGEQARILMVSMLNVKELDNNHVNNLVSLKGDLDSFELHQKVELAGKEHLQKSLFPDHDFGIPDLKNLEEIITDMFS